MIAFQKAITSFFPGAGLVAGLALIALGAGMVALGGRAAAGGGGAGGGSYGSGANNSQETVTQIRLMPGWAQGDSNVRARDPYVFAPTIIGTNDPSAQRAVVEMYDKGRRQRG